MTDTSMLPFIHEHFIHDARQNGVEVKGRFLFNKDGSLRFLARTDAPCELHVHDRNGSRVMVAQLPALSEDNYASMLLPVVQALAEHSHYMMRTIYKTAVEAIAGMGVQALIKKDGCTARFSRDGRELTLELLSDRDGNDVQMMVRWNGQERPYDTTNADTLLEEALDWLESGD